MFRGRVVIKRFNRYELKYILPIWRRDRIIAELDGFAQPDQHGGREGYRLLSLYYDSPGLDFFWAKVDGLKFRRKLRQRIYLDSRDEAPRSCMVEIKQRTNRTVQKRRLELPMDTADALCAGRIGVDALGRLDELDREVASEVSYLVAAMQLRPAAITAYRRLAFVGNRYESSVRITFDMELTGRVRDLTLKHSAPNFSLLGQDYCVLEVKSDETVPNWVTSLLARNGCQMQRMSKYCAAIAGLSGIHVPSLMITLPDALDAHAQNTFNSQQAQGIAK
jgi:SPX domain protein involved in polyphosphate accumulation